MTDHIANAYARLAEQPAGAPDMVELRAILLALRTAQSDAQQYSSDCGVYRRRIAEQAATIAALRTDLEMLKQPGAGARDAHVPAAHVPAAHVPAAHVPAAHVPAAHVPAAHVPTAHIPTAHVPTAHVPADHVPAHQRLVDALTGLKAVIETAVDAGAGRKFHHIQARRGGAFLRVAPALERADAALVGIAAPA